MALQRFLALVAGKITEFLPLTSSAGAASAGALIATNAAGTLDPTFLPTGIGADTQSMVASEALSAGALVNVWNNSGVANARNADGSTTGKQADGFVLAAVASAASATVYLGGINTSVTGQVPGLAFLSDTAVGALSATGASTAGHTYQQVGVVTAAGALQFDPQAPIVRA